MNLTAITVNRPGLRERMVFEEHKYCSNRFWRHYTEGLRLDWPYEVRDCFTRSTETGLYQFSHLFEQRIAHQYSWQMCPTLFSTAPSSRPILSGGIKPHANLASFPPVPLPIGAQQHEDRHRT